MCSKLRRDGFTLAEVLITLAIVGVVAALSVPGLIVNGEKQGYVNGLKKFVATFQNGMKTYMANQSCNDVMCTGLLDENTNNSTWYDRVEPMIKSTFNTSKTCRLNDHSCKIDGYLYLGGGSASDGNIGTSFFDSPAGFSSINTDGSEFQIYDTDPGNCTPSAAYPTLLDHYCALIYVDINGAKGPNIFGRDWFKFFLGNNGLLYPQGGLEMSKLTWGYNGSIWKTNVAYCGLTSTTIDSTWKGYGCAARIMEEGWQMNY